MPKRLPTEKNPNGSTGPNTLEGKKSSSKNALKHGCCSKILILPDEDPAEFERIAEGWLDQFDPADFQEESLVEALILNDWYLRRKRRHFFEAEAAAAAASGPDPAAWSPEQRHHIALMQRYKTAAERAFYCSWKTLQGLRKDIMNENLKLLKSLRNEVGLQEKVEKLEAQLRTPQARALDNPQTPARQLFRGQLSAKKRRKQKEQSLEQWVEIEQKDGKTVTTLFPSNEDLIKRGQAMYPPPEFVYRRLNFVNGVPPEYAWTSRHQHIRERGGAGIQRMDVDIWLEVIEREKLSGTGHIGPTGVGNLPRSENRGGCQCEICSHNRAILEAHASLQP